MSANVSPMPYIIEGLPDALSPDGMPDTTCLPVEMRDVTFPSGEVEKLPIYTLTQHDLMGLDPSLNAHLYEEGRDSEGRPLPYRVAVLESETGEPEYMRVTIEPGTPIDKARMLGVKLMLLARQTTGTR